MPPARKDKSGKPSSVKAKFAKIQKAATVPIAERPAPPPGLGTGPQVVSAGLALGSAAVPATLDKDQRISIMEADAAAAGKIVDEIAARMDSPDPMESRRASEAIIDARNTRDDLNENLAFLRDEDVFKPLDAGTIQHLDELADIIDARIKSAALLNATLAVLTETLHSATTIGDILDERV